MPGAPAAWQARSRGAGQTQVPLLIGQTLGAAQRAAASHQLAVAVASSRQDAYVEAGVIVAQDPAAAAGIAKGGTIHVVVSQGSGVVPDLRGLSADDARKLLGSAGLALGGTQQAFDDTVPAGMIVSESPEASAHLAPHSPVALVVSEGPANTAAPVAPTSAADQARAATAGRAPSTPVSTPSSTVATAGSAPAVVPNVTGVSLDRALAALRAARLRPGQVNYTHNGDLAAGFVIYQARVAGTEASANEAVDLLVSQGPSLPSQTAPSLRTPGQTQSTPTSP
jgi:beta-lactam-binding protein with PASTA domain